MTGIVRNSSSARTGVRDGDRGAESTQELIMGTIRWATKGTPSVNSMTVPEQPRNKESCL